MPNTEVESLCEAVSKRCPYTTQSEYTLISHILQVVSAIALDKKRVMSVGTHISAGETSVYLNVPAQIGSDGITSIVPLELDQQQREQFKKLVITECRRPISLTLTSCDVFNHYTLLTASLNWLTKTKRCEKYTKKSQNS